MQLTKSLALTLLSFSALALAAPPSVAAPSDFCGRLENTRERTECHSDRRQYCARLPPSQVKQECERNASGPGIAGRPPPPPQNYPPQNYPPQNYPPQNYPPYGSGYPYGGPPPPPSSPPQGRPGFQDCDLSSWSNIPSQCVQDCERAGGNREPLPPWCQRHCNQRASKGDSLPNWCPRNS